MSCGLKLVMLHPMSGDELSADFFLPHGVVEDPVGDIVGIVWNENPPGRRVVAVAVGVVVGTLWYVPFYNTNPGDNYSVEVFDPQQRVILAEVGPFKLIPPRGGGATLSISWPHGNDSFNRNASAYGTGPSTTVGSFFTDPSCTTKVPANPDGTPVTGLATGTWALAFHNVSPGTGRSLKAFDSTNPATQDQKDNITIT